MRLPLEERRKYYSSIEEVLGRCGIDYTIHLLAGGEEIGDFEEYWLTNLPQPTRLLPAMLSDSPEAEAILVPVIANALSEFENEAASLPYYVVLCGSGWTPERVEALRGRIPAPAGANLTIQTLDDFVAAGL